MGDYVNGGIYARGRFALGALLIFAKRIRGLAEELMAMGDMIVG